MVVYIDILVLINLYVNYFLLLATAKQSAVQVRFLRKLLGATVGAVFSLYIFIPETNVILSMLVKLVFSVVIIFSTFGFKNLKRFLRLLGVFYASSFLFAGIMLALWFAVKPAKMVVNNSVVYFNISPLLLIVSTLVCYFVLTLIRRFARRSQGADTSTYELEITYLDTTVKTTALLDTGHSLKDMFSDAPVIVTEYKIAAELLPRAEQPIFAGVGAPAAIPENFSGNFRLIPYSVVGGSGLLPAFKVDRVKVRHGKTEYIVKNVLVAVSAKPLSSDYSALISAELIQN